MVFYNRDTGRACDSEMLYFAVSKTAKYERLVQKIPNVQNLLPTWTVRKWTSRAHRPEIRPRKLQNNPDWFRASKHFRAHARLEIRGNFKIIQADLVRPSTSAHWLRKSAETLPNNSVRFRVSKHVFSPPFFVFFSVVVVAIFFPT